MIVVLLNSGATPEIRAELASKISKNFQDKQSQARVITIGFGDNFAEIAQKEVNLAKENGDVIVCAGGDGSVNTVADLCFKSDVTLGIIPLGTFNYFARDLSIPTDMDEAINIIISGHSRKITVGLVQDRVFLNNASFGIYTNLIRKREQASSVFGRARIVAAIAAAFSLLGFHKKHLIEFNFYNDKEIHKTAMVFIGNNTLQLENLGVEVADCTKEDRLAVVILKQTSKWDMARLLLCGAIGNLQNESRLVKFCADGFEINTNNKMMEIVLDGEIIKLKTPLKFTTKKHSLNVIVP